MPEAQGATLNIGREIMRTTSRLTSGVCILLWLTGCASNQPSTSAATTSPAQSRPKASVYHALVEVVNDANVRQTVPGDRSSYSLSFPVIAGSVIGKPGNTDLVALTAQIGDNLRLSEATLLNGLQSAATTIDPDHAAHGLVVDPADTRFARLATMGSSKSIIETVDSALFVDPSTRVAVVLLYFDRPCRVSGTVNMGQSRQATYDIVIPNAGLHWAYVQKPTADTYHFERADIEPRTVVLGLRMRSQ